MTANEGIGRKLREIREARRLTLSAVAKRVNISPSRLCHYESGRRPVPAVILNDLCNVYDADANKILASAGQPLEAVSP
jgi:transcriptional regulator with XRE-family HTH domain